MKEYPKPITLLDRDFLKEQSHAIQQQLTNKKIQHLKRQNNSFSTFSIIDNEKLSLNLHISASTRIEPLLEGPLLQWLYFFTENNIDIFLTFHGTLNDTLPANGLDRSLLLNSAVGYALAYYSKKITILDRTHHNKPVDLLSAKDYLQQLVTKNMETHKEELRYESGFVHFCKTPLRQFPYALRCLLNASHPTRSLMNEIKATLDNLHLRNQPTLFDDFLIEFIYQALLNAKEEHDYCSSTFNPNSVKENGYYGIFGFKFDIEKLNSSIFDSIKPHIKTPNKTYFCIQVADLGRGIPNSFKEHSANYSNASCIELIKTAFTFGNSTKSDGFHQIQHGFGLPLLLDSCYTLLAPILVEVPTTTALIIPNSPEIINSTIIDLSSENCTMLGTTITALIPVSAHDKS